MTFDFFEIFLLSTIQGISEFIPVSSSAHLFLISDFYNFKVQSLLTDIGLHLGSLLAIITYFHSDLSNIFKNKNLLFLIIFGSLPVIIVGAIIYQTNLITYLRNIEIIAWTTLVFAILLYFADKVKVNKKLNAKLNLSTIIIIGCFQILALIPGVSRSGIVITAGRFLKFNRYDSTKISFYLSIPAIAGASFLGLKDLHQETVDFNSMILFTVLLSYFFSYFTIKYFLIFVKRFDLKLFIIYRILLSFLLFGIIYF
jgi:undecaprenyl-diphosphatase